MSVDGTGERAALADGVLRVRPTPDGVATGVTHLTAALQTTGPARSHPDCRDPPPALRPATEPEVPPEYRRWRPPTGIEVRVPAALDAVFVAAPLAYYLGARLRATDETAPTVVAPEAGVRVPLPTGPALEEAVADLLRRTFFLDCLVRDVDRPPAAGTRAEPPARLPRVEEAAVGDLCPGDLGLDPAALRQQSPAARLGAYLELPAAPLRERTPRWHLTTYVDPGEDTISALPHLLDALSIVRRPRATRCPEQDLLEYTLEGAYETRGDGTAPARLLPDFDDSHAHAWLAPGTPVGACKATPAALATGGRRGESAPPTAGVTVVLGKADSAAEAEAALSAYRDAAAADPVRLLRTPTVSEARTALARDAGLVHFVGHCDEAGLRCADGHLDLADLPVAGCRGFVLNACGSYEQGLALLERGSVAGAVTLREVLDANARKVGTALGRLLVRGFEVGRATRIASRRILMGADYVAVGDGTARLVAPPSEPVVCHLDRADNRFHLRARGVATDRTGHRLPAPLPGNAPLNGAAVAATYDRADLVALLSEVSLPVIYEGAFHWSSDLAAALESDG